jgi:hypothetical protein
MRFSVQFKGHDNNGQFISEMWTRLVLSFDPSTESVSIVAHWKGYDSLLKCADVAEDLRKICAYIHRSHVTPEYLTACAVTSKYPYRVVPEGYELKID